MLMSVRKIQIIVDSFVQNYLYEVIETMSKNSSNSTNFFEGEKSLILLIFFLLFAFLKKMHCNRLRYIICNNYFFVRLTKKGFYVKKTEIFLNYVFERKGKLLKI